MPLLHLIDRPNDVPYAFEERRKGLGTLASAASHGAVVLLVVVTVQVAQKGPVSSDITRFDPHLVWVPSLDAGGGRSGGGDESSSRARKLEMPGRDKASIATIPDRSIDSTVEQQIEPLPISAQPMGNAPSMLVGSVTSESAGHSLGPNNGPGGDGDGPTSGRGKGPGNGFGDGAFGGPNVTTPVVITQVKPQYTADAMRAKVQGLVMVECVVLPDGTVGDARILRSLDPRFGLDHEAIAAAKKWRFKPGMMNGKPVPVVVTIELSFTLR